MRSVSMHLMIYVFGRHSSMPYVSHNFGLLFTKVTKHWDHLRLAPCLIHSL